MAPAKRHSVGGAGAAAKRPKKSLVETKCETLQRALRNAVTVDASETLTIVLPFALGVPSEERHKIHHEAVEMIEAAFKLEEEHLEGCVKDTAAALEAAKKEQEENSAASRQTQEDLEAARCEVRARIVALANDARAYLAAKEAFNEAELAREAGSQESRSAGKKQEEAQALADQLDSIHETPSEIPRYIRRLGSHVEIEDTMKTAIPCALSLDPATRGSFDALVTKQLADKLQMRITALKELLDNAEVLAKKHDGAVEDARAPFDEARAKQNASAKAYTEASNKAEALESAAKAGSKAAAQLASKAGKMSVAASEAQADLEYFREGPLADFVELRDQKCGGDSGEAAADAAAAATADATPAAEAMQLEQVATAA